MACQVFAVIHTFLFFCLHPVYRTLWSAPKWCWCLSCRAVYVFSASARAWSLLFSWRVKVLFALGSFTFFTSNCCCLALPGPFPLSFRFRFAVTSWWSLPTSASLPTLTSCNNAIFSLSRWSSAGRSGSCLFHWGSTRWACGFRGVERLSLRWPNRKSCRIQVAFLYCCSCCDILPFLWLYRDFCCHFPFSHFSRPSLSSSHGVMCTLARLATGRKMHSCSLPHCRWSVHNTGW